MLNIVIATNPMAGHVGPLRPIARELVDRGHRVRWYTGRNFAATVEGLGADFRPMSPELEPDERPLDEAFPERARLRGLSKLRWDLKNIFVAPATQQVEDLRKLLAEEPADLIVADATLTGARFVRELGGPRLVTVGVTPLTLPDRDLAPFGPGLQPATNFVGRARNAALRRILDRFVFRDVEAYTTEVRASLGLPPSDIPLMSGAVSPELHLQAGVAAFEHPRASLPPQVRFAGAMADRSPGGSGIPRPDWWPDVTSSSRPVIHVTQGTVANSDLDELVLPTIRALAEEDVLVVAITGSTDPRYDVAHLPANARMAPLLPYDDLLPLTSVLVTNGGFGTVNQALSHGIPVVAAGTTEDKPEVGARIRRSGVGIDLRSSKPREAEIRRAVRRLVDEPTFRRRARELAADFDAAESGPFAADLLEELAASPARLS